MKKLTAFLLIWWIAGALLNELRAQTALMSKACRVYEMLAYSEAAPLFEKVIKNDSLNFDALLKLAECYRMTNDLNGQLRIYRKIVTRGIGKPLHSYYYAQALMQAGNYRDAAFYLALYNADERGVTFLSAVNDIARFFRDSSAYTISKMPFNSDQTDFSPTIWKGDQIVFASSRAHAVMVSYQYPWTNSEFCHLYVTTRKKNGKYRRPRRFLPHMETRFNDGPLCFSLNSRDLYVTRNAVSYGRALASADGQIKLRLVRGQISRKGREYIWSGDFEYNNEGYNVAHPALSPDGRKLYFSSDKPGGYGGMDIYVCFAQGNMWGTPVNLGPKVNSSGNEVFPAVKGDKYLCFSSNGLAGIGGLDIFETAVDSFGMPYGKVFNLGVPLNSSGDDFGITFAAGARSGYFASNRNNFDSNDDIYDFRQLKDVKRTVTIKGVALDSISRKIIPGAAITLLGESGEPIANAVADENGTFIFEADFEKDYTIISHKEKYVDGITALSTKEMNEFEVKVEVLMPEEPQITFTMLVVDAKTQVPLPGVLLSISDMITGKVRQVKTSDEGTFRYLLWDKKVGDSIILALGFSKDGYITRTGTFRYRIPKPGNITTTELLNKFELGLDLAKVIEIKPIYFNLGKADIRDDAKIELDKVVQIMKENPTIVIEIGSHTDCRGTRTSNSSLSERRAKASVAYIISKGIEASRISGKGYGESKPVNKCECEGNRRVPCTEKEHQMNRRTEFLIIKF